MQRESIHCRKASVTRRIAIIAFTIAAGISTAAAQTEYKFTNIADTKGDFSAFEVDSFSLNSNGTVAFSAPLKAGGRAIYKWSGGALQKIAKTGETIDTIPIVDLGRSAFIDFSGNVVFNAVYNDTTEVIYKSSGAGKPDIVSGYFYYNNSPPAVSSSGKVAWTGFNGFQSSGGVDTSRYYVLRNPENGATGQNRYGAIIAHSGAKNNDLNGYFSNFVAANISDSGSVLFRGIIRAGGEGIFIGKEPLPGVSTPGNANTTVIADSVSPGSNFAIFGNRPDINSSDIIVFGAQTKTGGRVICRSFAGGAPGVYVDDTGVFSFLGADPAINDGGTVRFTARVRKTNKAGIFTGPDPVADSVIQTGQSLLGSTLVELGGGPRTLSNKGQIVFYYKLADGRTGLALADPAGAKKPTGDLAIKQEKQPASAYATHGVFLRTAAGTQLKEVSFEPEVGSSAVFNVELTNTASDDKQYALFGTETGDTGWKIQAFFGTTDYWSQMKSPGILAPTLKPGEKLLLRIVVTGSDSTKPLPYNTKKGFILAVTAGDDTTFTHDAVGANVETVKALVVNSTGDEAAVNPSVGPDSNKDKPGDQITLRSAVQYANAHIGKDIIKFKIPDNDPGKVNGVWFIKPQSALPAINEPVTIDGRTQNTNSITPTVELDGQLLHRPAPPVQGDQEDLFERQLAYSISYPSAASGLTIDPGGAESEIHGLAVTSFPFFGIEVKGGATIIEGCHIGIDVLGQKAKANGHPALLGGGILLKFAGNHIGGSTSRSRNVISGTCLANQAQLKAPLGLIIATSAASGNVVEGNYFGTEATGEFAPAHNFSGSQVPDALTGVAILNAPDNTIGGNVPGAGNVFANHFIGGAGVVREWGNGVMIVGSLATGNRVQGNNFGASASYSRRHPNALGVLVSNAPNNVIGGGDASARNYFVASIDLRNFLGGLTLNTGGLWVVGAQATNNQVVNNVFGSGPNDKLSITQGGVINVQGNLASLAPDIVLAQGSGPTLFSHNISAAGLVFSDAHNCLVQTNTFTGGDTAISFTGDIHGKTTQPPSTGIFVESNTIRDFVYGVVANDPNVGKANFTLTRNSISRVKMGIAFTAEGQSYSVPKPAPNDSGDADTGPNGLQNYPILGRARIANGINVQGSLSTNVGSRVYRIEFFANTVVTTSGYGPGERYLGSVNVTTGVGGDAGINFSANVPVGVGEFITATATDPNGNTSEFSRAIPVETGNDNDLDGVDNELENKVPGRTSLSSSDSRSLALSSAATAAQTGDGNGDGILDSQQANVASLIGLPNTWLTLATSSGVKLVDVTPSGPPDFTSLPAGYEFPVGFLSFKATGIPIGGSVKISEIFHGPVRYTTVFAYGPTTDNSKPHWYQFVFDGTTGADLNKAGEIAFTFKDGGRGDHDLQKNGQVTTILAPAVSTTSLLNVATRMRVQTGENVLIAGFIITGTEPKKVIIRGIGPSLSSFFNGVLPNPTLELFQGNTLLQSNDDWKTSQKAEIVATGIAPANDLESAIVRTLAPGAYTAVLRGSGNSAGIGVVEAYDLNQTANSRLANIATRGFVETGNNVMIGGFIIGGTAEGGGGATVVVRAIGPSLGNFGIAGALQDPTLDLINVNGTVLRSNDNWKTSQRAEIEGVGLQPSDERESALTQILAPGTYTAIVRGNESTSGVGLVEVYHLQ